MRRRPSSSPGNPSTKAIRGPASCSTRVLSTPRLPPLPCASSRPGSPSVLTRGGLRAGVESLVSRMSLPVKHRSRKSGWRPASRRPPTSSCRQARRHLGRHRGPSRLGLRPRGKPELRNAARRRHPCGRDAAAARLVARVPLLDLPSAIAPSLSSPASAIPSRSAGRRRQGRVGAALFGSARRPRGRR
jgi:hypothetical protein